MSGETVTVAAFVLARLAEDEHVAANWPDELPPPPDGHAFWRDTHGHLIYQPRRRVLDKCKADRRIVEWCAEVIGDRDLSSYAQSGCLRGDPQALAVTLAVETLRLLASSHADHPDYRTVEWAPGE